MNLPIAFNEFWRIASAKMMEITPFQGYLYMALVHLANENRWETNIVSVSNSKLMRLSSITNKSSFIKTRSALIKKKLIKFEAGKTDHTYSKYTLIFEKKTSVLTGINKHPVQEITGTPTGTPTGLLTGSNPNPVVPIIEEINKKKSSSEVNFKFLK